MNTRVIAVADNKGGVGKTTTAGVLADGLARMCIRHQSETDVLVVDLDPQGNQADFFGVRADMLAERLCVGNVLMEPGDIQLLQNNIISVDREEDGLPRPNLYLLPASRNLEDVTQDLVVMTTMRTARRSGLTWIRFWPMHWPRCWVSLPLSSLIVLLNWIRSSELSITLPMKLSFPSRQTM